jgi:hypothetical protein
MFNHCKTLKPLSWALASPCKLGERGRSIGLRELVVAYGYRSNEIEALKDPPVSAAGVSIKYTHEPFHPDRKPVAVSLGPILDGSLPPHADPNCRETLRKGVEQRIGANIPSNRDRRRKNRLKMEVYKIIRERNLKPFSKEINWTFETWLEMTGYPEWRKVELRKYRDEIDDLLKRNKWGELSHFVVKLFMKDEHYVDFKHARGIYARDEAAKIVFGPWFKLMENVVYDTNVFPEFIKHVPVKDRPDYIYNHIHNDAADYIATDFTSFEAHFTADLMESVEFVLYEYLLSEVPGGLEVLALMKETLLGENRIFNKFLKVRLIARRMSGEMNTSLGNGFSNLIFMRYICTKIGLDSSKVKGVVEGDDGLFAFIGLTPTTQDFVDSGFKIKLNKFSRISDAGFCGQLFDEDDRKVITDPYKVVSLFGWTNVRYLRARNSKKTMLLRCKALSMAYQYPACPIIGAMANYGMRMTRSYDVAGFIEKRRDISLYEYEKLKLANANKEPTYIEPGMGTRLLFEELYGISVSQQRRIEKYFDEKDDLNKLCIPELSENSPVSWGIYFDKYVGIFEPAARQGDFIMFEMRNLRN